VTLVGRPVDKGVLATLVDTFAREQVARSGVAGAVVGVWVRGIDFLRSYGLADVKAQTPLRVGHKFRVGSINQNVHSLGRPHPGGSGALAARGSP